MKKPKKSVKNKPAILERAVTYLPIPIVSWIAMEATKIGVNESTYMRMVWVEKFEQSQKELKND